MTNLIQQGKNVILDNVSKNIEKEFTNQIDTLQKLEEYEKSWKQFYHNHLTIEYDHLHC